MVDIHELLRARERGQTYLQWVDEDGLVVGMLSRQAMTDTSVTLFYRLYGTRNVECGSGTIEVAIRYSKGGKYWKKPNFVCPKCGRDAVRLYYVRGYWACKISHNIISITQRLDKINKAFYRIELQKSLLNTVDVDKEIQKKIDKGKQKYGAAVSLIANQDREKLPLDMEYRTFGRWLPAGEVPVEPDTSGVGYGWTPGMSGQLAGLEPMEVEQEWPAPDLGEIKQQPSEPVYTAAELQRMREEDEAREQDALQRLREVDAARRAEHEKFMKSIPDLSKPLDFKL